MKLIANRYSIQNKLGQGGSSITYGVVDRETNETISFNGSISCGITSDFYFKILYARSRDTMVTK